MPRPASLSLAMPQSTSAVSSTMTSPVDPGSGFSSPDSSTAASAGPGFMARHHKSSKSVPFSISGSSSPQVAPASPELTSLPAFPSSPKDPSKHARDTSKGFFSNLKASKSSNKVPGLDSSTRQISEEVPRQTDTIPPRGLYALRKGPGSTPDLSLSSFEASPNIDAPSRNVERSERPMASSVGSDGAIPPHHSDLNDFKKPKPRFHNLMGRTKSTRVDADGPGSKPTTPVTADAPIGLGQFDGADDRDDAHFRANHPRAPLPRAPPPRTAPLRPDRALRDMMGSNLRGQSSDRPSSNHSNENQRPRQIAPHGSASNSTTQLSSSASGSQREAIGSREGPGSKLFANISSRAAEGFGRARKGLLRRMERRPSNIGREEEPPYVIQTINLPLVEQTRKTRIAARLEDSKDKTEFWMPSLPWRCIDYLNVKGTEEEGIYRIPGSELQIRHWQKRFDREGDIDLNFEPELYDVNIVGSMFKSWLRDLPDEIFPKETQIRIARENPNAKEVPQMLRDELSQLPPWNYYLLFAITCHLSLLISRSNVNRMTYNNLCVCFQPCLKIDSYCFRFLVEHWQQCWQGCFTEKHYLEEEYLFLLAGGEFGMEEIDADELEELMYSSPPSDTTDSTVKAKPSALSLDLRGNESSHGTPVIANLEHQNGQTTQPSMVSRVPELAPMKPLSPIMTEFKNTSPEKQQHTHARG